MRLFCVNDLCSEQDPNVDPEIPVENYSQVLAVRCFHSGSFGRSKSE